LNLRNKLTATYMFEYLYKNKVVWMVMVLFLGFFFQFSLDVIFSLIYRNHSLFGPWYSYVFSVSMSLIIVYGLIKVSVWINKRYSWEKAPDSHFYTQIIMVTMFAVFMVLLLRFIVTTIMFPGGFIRLLDEVVIAVFFSVVSLLLVFIDLGINLLHKWRYSLAEIERFKKENLETQFEMLRMQVNPHFLFNSLNTLSSLIYQNQDTASQFVRELSSVYRYILEKRKSELSTLDEELLFIDSYKYLLSLRFDKKLVFEMSVDENSKEKMIVPLTLQILIENAVKHNVISAKKPLTIAISTHSNNTLEVRNNLQPKQTSSYSSGIGLDNIRSRLEILTDRQIEVEKTEEEFIVRVPLLSIHKDKLVNW